MNKSDDIKDLATALCKAQSEMGAATKDATNPFFKSKYADLGAVVAAVKEPFNANGLSYSQMPISDESGRVGVTTILMHSSGQWVSSDLLLKPSKPDPQAAGSTITYARRYALQSIAGIPAEDDDGNAASKPPKDGSGAFDATVVAAYMRATPEDQNSMWIALDEATQTEIIKQCEARNAAI